MDKLLSSFQKCSKRERDRDRASCGLLIMASIDLERVLAPHKRKQPNSSGDLESKEAKCISLSWWASSNSIQTVPCPPAGLITYPCLKFEGFESLNCNWFSFLYGLNSNKWVPGPGFSMGLFQDNCLHLICVGGGSKSKQIGPTCCARSRWWFAASTSRSLGPRMSECMGIRWASPPTRVSRQWGVINKRVYYVNTRANQIVRATMIKTTRARRRRIQHWIR